MNNWRRRRRTKDRKTRERGRGGMEWDLNPHVGAELWNMELLKSQLPMKLTI
jgi:hypothetical protein